MIPKEKKKSSTAIVDNHMQNVFYKDDQEYSELLKKVGKDVPKQIYFKTKKTHPSKRLYDSQNASGYRIADQEEL